MMSDNIASSGRMIGLEDVPDTSQKYYCLGQCTWCNLVSTAQLSSELQYCKNWLFLLFWHLEWVKSIILENVIRLGERHGIYCNLLLRIGCRKILCCSPLNGHLGYRRLKIVCWILFPCWIYNLSHCQVIFVYITSCPNFIYVPLFLLQLFTLKKPLHIPDVFNGILVITETLTHLFSVTQTPFFTFRRCCCSNYLVI
jgi:hypothetical protein